VALCDLRPAELDSTVAELRQGGGSASGHPLDVTDRAAFVDVVEEIEQRLGGIDLLVNNAGVGYTGVALHETPDADIDWVIDVNLRGVLNGIKAVVPSMVARRHGHVLNVSSMSGLAVPEGIQHGLYGATKAAVVFLSEGLRQDVAPFGVGVSVLCPGYVRSNLPVGIAFDKPSLAKTIMDETPALVVQNKGRVCEIWCKAFALPLHWRKRTFGVCYKTAA